MASSSIFNNAGTFNGRPRSVYRSLCHGAGSLAQRRTNLHACHIHQPLPAETITLPVIGLCFREYHKIGAVGTRITLNMFILSYLRSQHPSASEASQ